MTMKLYICFLIIHLLHLALLKKKRPIISYHCDNKNSINLFCAQYATSFSSSFYRIILSLISSQSQEITQPRNLHAAIVYVIARLLRQCQTPQKAQIFLLPKSAVHYLRHLESKNIIGQRKTANKQKLLSMIYFV